MICRYGGIGRHKRLKISRGQPLTGSSPVSGTKQGPGAIYVAPGPLLCPKSVGEAQASKPLKRDRPGPEAICVAPGLFFLSGIQGGLWKTDSILGRVPNTEKAGKGGVGPGRSYPFPSASFTSSCMVSRNFSAALVNIWYFFQTRLIPAWARGSSGRKQRWLSPAVLMILSRQIA